MIKKLSLFGGLAAVLVHGSAAQELGNLTDPNEILRRAAFALKAVTTVEYDAEAFSLQESGRAKPTADGTVLLQGFLDHVPEKFRLRGTFRHDGASQGEALVLGSDAKNCYLIDSKEKTAYVGRSPRAMGPRRRLGFLLLILEFVHPEPLSYELKKRKKKYLGPCNVGGERCFEVSVELTAGREVHWFFSTKDLLPRRVDRIDVVTRGNERVTRGSRIVVNSLKSNPRIEEGAFAFTKPAGFTVVGESTP